MDKPTLDEWLAKLPNLMRKTTQVEGPCPLCGGRNRFSVDVAPPHNFRCRSRMDGGTENYGAEILRKVFGANGSVPNDSGPRRPVHNLLGGGPGKPGSSLPPLPRAPC